MITLSIRALGVGLILAAALAVVANVLTLPMWSIYVAFVAIVGATVVLNLRLQGIYDGPQWRRRRGSNPAH